MPIHDGARHLPAMLASLARQDIDEPWELVAVLDRCTDRTDRVLEEWRERLPSLSVHRLDEPGPATCANARNVGVAHSTGARLVFLDHDDEVPSNYLSAVHRALDEHELVCVPWDPRLLNPSRVARERAVHAVAAPLGRAPWLFAPEGALAMRREVFDSVGPLDPTCGTSCNDDWCFRAAALGHRMHAVTDTVLHYRFRTEARASYRQGRSWGLSETLVWNEWADRVDGEFPHHDASEVVVRLARSYLPHVARLVWDRDGRAVLAFESGHLAGVVDGLRRRHRQSSRALTATLPGRPPI
jgi:glycosyltransferase involved in cell wall biosynthesis